MKHLMLTLLFATNAVFSQSVFTVVDSISKEPLELATVRFLKSDYTSFTNYEGLLQDIPEGESEAEMSYIGYKTKLLDLEAVNDTVFLQPDVTQLSELVLEKQVNYTHTQKLKSTKVDEYQFGTEHCVYVENESLKKGRVAGITLYLSKLKDFNAVERVG